MEIARAVETLKKFRDNAVHELDKIARIRHQYEEQIKIGEPWYWKWEDSWHPLAAKRAEEELESINMAIKALEMQKPEAVINRKVWEHVTKTFDTCPNCKEIVGDLERYCHWCGQAIKWN